MALYSMRAQTRDPNSLTKKAMAPRRKSARALTVTSEDEPEQYGKSILTRHSKRIDGQADDAESLSDAYFEMLEEGASTPQASDISFELLDEQEAAEEADAEDLEVEQCERIEEMATENSDDDVSIASSEPEEPGEKRERGKKVPPPKRGALKKLTARQLKIHRRRSLRQDAQQEQEAVEAEDVEEALPNIFPVCKIYSRIV
jgi:hypothetical protein